MVGDNVPAGRSPERIGRYTVIGRIGRGAMGVVYHARDEVMHREVALKVLTADLEDDADIRTRFLREAQAAAGLSHPNVITIYDVGEENDRFFIVMELLRGALLKEFLKQPDGARLSSKLELMTQLCAGLGAAHRASIIHRDIKPGNLFVRSDGLLKILDFGVARLATSSMTAAGFVVGTPDYMSPEQARGEEIDARSDIFSVGGVLYMMLTGRKPFPATVLPTLFHQIQSEEPPPIGGDVPPELAALVMKALSKNRETRYQTCEALLADLQLVRHLYPDEVASAHGAHVSADRAAVDGAGAIVATTNGSVPPAFSAPAVEGASTEDTVDLEPPAAGDATDDTVTLEAPASGWRARVRSSIHSAIAGAVARAARSKR